MFNSIHCSNWLNLQDNDAENFRKPFWSFLVIRQHQWLWQMIGILIYISWLIPTIAHLLSFLRQRWHKFVKTKAIQPLLVVVGPCWPVVWCAVWSCLLVFYSNHIPTHRFLPQRHKTGRQTEGQTDRQAEGSHHALMPERLRNNSGKSPRKLASSFQVMNNFLTEIYWSSSQGQKSRSNACRVDMTVTCQFLVVVSQCLHGQTELQHARTFTKL